MRGCSDDKPSDSFDLGRGVCASASKHNEVPAVQVFEAAPHDVRGVPAKKAAPDYFL